MGEIHPRYMVLQQKNGVLQDEWIVPPVHMFPKCIIFSFLLHGMISQLIFIVFPSILLLHCHFWLVVSNMNGLWLSISYMGCHPSHWRTHIFQDGFLTTNQIIDPFFMVKLVKPPFFTGKIFQYYNEIRMGSYPTQEDRWKRMGFRLW
jgi:hypothetical protein